MREPALIELIAARVSRGTGVLVGIGDDAAVLAGDGVLVAAHDMVVEDVHFRLSYATPADVGHRALAANISDMAAMAAQPAAALVGLAVGPGLDDAGVAGMYAAMDALGARWGCAVVGGDVSTAAVTMVGVTVLGRMPAGVAPVLRSGGRPGDVVVVTGAVGASAAGLALLQGRAPAGEASPALRAAHLRPEPRVEAGQALARAGATALIDCSDGLALDLDRLARASGLAVDLDLDRVPVAPGVAEVAAAVGDDPAAFAATGGEDYELIAAVPPGALAAARAAVAGPLTVVGTLRAGPPGVRVVRGGRPVALPRLGWQHDG